MSEGDRFAMECWHDAGWFDGAGRVYETAGWERMDRGAGGSTWRPRPSAAAAVRKCLTWTGLTGIPTMRVVDLADNNQVVWQFGTDDDAHAGAGPLRNHRAWWFQAAWASARADLRGEPAPAERPPAIPGQEVLW